MTCPQKRAIIKEKNAQLLKKYKIEKVFTNGDYEPYALQRDAGIQKLLAAHGASLHSYKDQVIFEKDEVVKDDGKPYTVFTPYSRRWKAALTDFYLKSYPVKKYLANLLQQKPVTIPSLKSMGFIPVDTPFPSAQLNTELVKKYNFQNTNKFLQQKLLHIITQEINWLVSLDSTKKFLTK